MKLSTKGRHAITAMMELALRHQKGPVTLADISAEQSISVSYLEQLFTRLRKHGLVASTRGPGGGYSLSRSASEIPVSAVVTAVDESVDATRCGGRGDCHDGRRCLTHDLWSELSDQIHVFLSEISLGQLVEQGRAKQSAIKDAARQGIAVSLAPTGRAADPA